MAYKHILLALELDPNADEGIITRARTIQAQFNSKLSLIHAVEHYVNFGAAYSVAGGVDIESELMNAATESMSVVGSQLHVPREDQIIATGSAKHLIVDEAKERDVDLIVVGSHGRHGVRLLLGSTANAVIHGAHCDVLAVRLDDN